MVNQILTVEQTPFPKVELCLRRPSVHLSLDLLPPMSRPLNAAAGRAGLPCGG